MRKLMLVLPLLFLWGCTLPQQRITYNTLYSTHVAVDAAYDGYNDLVLKGAVATNDVPKVAQAYRTFQASWNLALQAAMFTTNAITPPTVAAQAMAVLSTISTAEGK